MSNKGLTADQRQALETSHTWQRIVEPRLEPVRGQFDSAHLKEINRCIFQDLPSVVFQKYHQKYGLGSVETHSSRVVYQHGPTSNHHHSL